MKKIIFEGGPKNGEITAIPDSLTSVSIYKVPGLTQDHWPMVPPEDMRPLELDKVIYVESIVKPRPDTGLDAIFVLRENAMKSNDNEWVRESWATLVHGQKVRLTRDNGDVLHGTVRERDCRRFVIDTEIGTYGRADLIRWKIEGKDKPTPLPTEPGVYVHRGAHRNFASGEGVKPLVLLLNGNGEWTIAGTGYPTKDAKNNAERWTKSGHLVRLDIVP